ncbi:imm11 family protein [Marinicellulosiphila megalodicopiae]|uniref:imm11 family protein n=1 Tax=Marinicellulosiphila megalodicopiae TaxID=2724896 RepID=UPI003BAE2F3A
MTTNFNEEYYLILRENNDYYPTIDGFLQPRYRGMKVNNEDPVCVNLNLALTNGKKDQFVDYHSSGGDSICSKAFVDFIISLGTGGVQFLEGTHGTIVEKLKLKYFYMHVYRRIRCIDQKKSDLDIDETGYIDSIKSISIDAEILNKIPLEERQIFFLDESAYIKLFHQSIVEKIQATDMKGFQFVKVKDWSIHSAFS